MNASRPALTATSARRAGAGLALLVLAGTRLALALPPDPLPGRLFHSAQERAAMDRPPAPPLAPGVAHRAPPRAPVRPERSPALSGFVLRSDGHDSFWLDAGSAPAAPLTR